MYFGFQIKWFKYNIFIFLPANKEFAFSFTNRMNPRQKPIEII